ncbi:MAG TPA: hypothetical protein VK445_09640 [Dissulfurispiraceae bacterium]|nr:hypothetical protein [Dissulfurispiraceae bacterium]
MAAFYEGMSDDEAVVSLKDFAPRFLGFVQRFSIQFYRDIHSHDAEGFPAVREEYFFLLSFFVQKHISCYFAGRWHGHLDCVFHDSLAAAFVKGAKPFDRDAFDALWASRFAGYASQKEPAMVLAMFNAHLQARLFNWHKLVTHHSGQIAMEALAELMGEAFRV